MSEKQKSKIKFKLNKTVDLKKNKKWIIFVIIISFISSIMLNSASEAILGKLSIIPSFFILLFIIMIGIFFDIVGTAVTASVEEPFHAMAAKKVFGAKEAVYLIRNANKVSSICNDVIGDVAGIISGTASVFIVMRASAGFSTAGQQVMSYLTGGVVASLTIGGKALGKVFALRYSDFFVFGTGRFIALFMSVIDKIKRR